MMKSVDPQASVKFTLENSDILEHEENKFCQSNSAVNQLPGSVLINATPKHGRKRKNSYKRERCSDRFILADVTKETDTTPSSRKQGKGRRRQNRLENVRYLLSLWDKDVDEEHSSVSEEEPSFSVFSKVVTEDKMRKIWDEFAALSGEEQDMYLKFIEDSKNRTSAAASMTSLKSPDSIETDVSTHPAFRKDESSTIQNDGNKNPRDILLLEEADECYQRIEIKLKRALNEPHLPMDLLKAMEDDVIDYFTKFPSSLYKSKLENSYERLLLHALCQYLGLESTSVTQNGSRQTHIKHDQVEFSPPAIPLSEYIGKQR